MADVRQVLVIRTGATVGDRIRLARLAAGLEQVDCAEQLGISVRTYQRVEDGTRGLRPAEAARLAELTGQDISLFATPVAAGRKLTAPRRTKSTSPRRRTAA